MYRNLKLRGTVSSIEKLEPEIKKGFNEYIKNNSRFFELYTQKSFYRLGTEDEKLIYEKIGTMRNMYEGQSIFFPLTFETYMPVKAIWSKELKQISDICDNHFWTSESQKREVKEQIKQLEEAVSNVDVKSTKENQEWQKRLFFETVIKVFTGSGLYSIFNYCLKSGKPDKIEAFKEYAYALRGSMFILGEPILNESNTYYRGMTMRKTIFENWKKLVGEYFLFPTYTSTTADLNMAQHFLNSKSLNSGAVSVMIIINLTNDVKPFVEKMKEMKEVYNGIYFPVDIYKYSVFANKGEVLFPPFYPFLLKGVEQEQSICKITLLAPNYLSFGKMRPRGGELPQSKLMRKSLLDSTNRLLKFHILNVLDLSKFFLYLFITIFIGGVFKEDLVKSHGLTSMIKAALSSPPTNDIQQQNLFRPLEHLNLSIYDIVFYKAFFLKII